MTKTVDLTIRLRRVTEGGAVLQEDVERHTLKSKRRRAGFVANGEDTTKVTISGERWGKSYRRTIDVSLDKPEHEVTVDVVADAELREVVRDADGNITATRAYPTAVAPLTLEQLEARLAEHREQVEAEIADAHRHMEERLAPLIGKALAEELARQDAEAAKRRAQAKVQEALGARLEAAREATDA